MVLPLEIRILMTEAAAPMLLISALQRQYADCVDLINDVMKNLPMEHPLRSKLRMIVAIKENRPLDAIKVVLERPVAEQDEHDVMVLLKCAFETMVTPSVIVEKPFAVPALPPPKVTAFVAPPPTPAQPTPKKYFGVEHAKKLCEYFKMFDGMLNQERTKHIAEELQISELRVKSWFRNHKLALHPYLKTYLKSPKN